MKGVLQAVIATIALMTQAAVLAAEGTVPATVPAMPTLNHVFLIVLENHSYSDIRGNTLAPFINSMADTGAVATAYSAVTHPSLPNYLAMVGGSDFNVASDDSPDWHSTTCTPFTAGKTVCPLDGIGTENSTGTANIIGKNIGEQLLANSLTWKNYEQSLPSTGADGVNFSDGFYSNLTDFTSVRPDANTSNETMLGYVAHLYAVKHNPFVYFKNGGQDSQTLLRQANFDGDGGLFADLRAGKVANLSFIVPNQCNDEHGVGGSDHYCTSGPALIQRSDQTVATLVRAIKASPAWTSGHNAIVLVWDEDDYSERNQVPLIVATNRGTSSSTSSTPYNHYSLLKTLEAGFGLPCLNHACDNNVRVMRDMFNGLNR